MSVLTLRCCKLRREESDDFVPGHVAYSTQFREDDILSASSDHERDLYLRWLRGKLREF